MNENNILTRLEVIDETGRIYVNSNSNFRFSYQDGGRTLKIFVSKNKTKFQKEFEEHIKWFNELCKKCYEDKIKRGERK